MEKEEKGTHLDAFLKDCFVCYFCSLKENGEELGYTRIQTALFSALGGLDDCYNSAEFIEKTHKNFEIISQHLGKVAEEMYKEQRRREGIRDSHSNLEIKYSVKDVSRSLNISEQAVRKAILEGRLKAQKGSNGSYFINSSDLQTFKSNRKRK